MKRSVIAVTALTCLGVASLGCDSAPSTAGVSREPQSASRTDSSGTATETEFKRRLAQYNGTLREMSLTPTGVRATWTSGKCDYLDGEIIDLLLSVNRTVKTSPDITATRTCDGKTASYALSRTDFERYRTGQINDSAVLQGLKQ